MPKFKEYNQNQIMLLPPNINDWMPKDHQCFIVNEVVNKLDISCVENTYSDNGASAYNPRMLIKVIFYSYMEGIRSSRKIENSIYENIVYRYLSANQFPDHGTINLFRKNHLKDLESLFAQIVILCNGLGLINFSDISIDGSIFKANASRKSTYSQETITKLKKKIKEIFQKAEQIDEEEDKKYGRHQRGYSEMPERLKDPETRKKEIERLQEDMGRKMKKVEKASQIISKKQRESRTKKEKELHKNRNYNITDPDANLMKLKNGNSYHPAYNNQIATSNQVILAYDVNDDGVDTKQLIPMIDKTEKNTQQKVKIVKADASYFSRDNLEEIERRSIDAYIPDKRKSIEERQEKNQEISRYDRKNFKYNQEKDRFICPENKILFLKSIDNRGVKKYKCLDCPNCPVKSQCIKGKNRYLKYNSQFEKYKSEMRQKLNSPRGKSKYLERMSDVEPVFGNIVYNQRARQFLCRGKSMVKIEFGLSCIAHNLTKISNWIKKSKRNIQSIQYTKQKQNTEQRIKQNPIRTQLETLVRL